MILEAVPALPAKRRNGHQVIKRASRHYAEAVGLMLLEWNAHASDIGLVVFGVYCLLIGYLIFKSTFLPRVLGILMVFGGIGLVTYLSPALASDLYPYNAVPAFVGETLLMLWLLVMGVNVQQREKLASAAR